MIFMFLLLAIPFSGASKMFGANTLDTHATVIDENPLITALEKNDQSMTKKLFENSILLKKLINKPRIEKGFINEIPLTIAVKKGDVLLVKKLVSLGADVRWSDWQEKTLLMDAVANNDLAMVQALIGLGVDVNKMNKNRETALAQAIMLNYTALVDFLLTVRDVTTNTRDGKGDTPLMIAARMNLLSVAEKLIAKNPSDINARNNQGETALSQAISNKNWDMALLLADLGSPLDVQDREGNTPAMRAFLAGRLDVVEQFLKHGANITIANHNGQTLLTLAAEQGNLAVISLLAQYGDAISRAVVSDGSTVLHMFIKQKRWALVPQLVQLKVDIDARDNQGNTPLMLAASLKNKAMVKLLLNAGANVTLKNSAGQSVMDLAQGDQELVILIQSKLSPAAVTPAIAQPVAAPEPSIESPQHQEQSAVIIPPTPGSDAAAASYTPPPTFTPPPPAASNEKTQHPNESSSMQRAQTSETVNPK